MLLFALVPLWLATQRARGQFRARFGRKPTDRELDSLAAWLQDPPPAAPPPARRPDAPASPETSFGRDPHA